MASSTQNDDNEMETRRVNLQAIDQKDDSTYTDSDTDEMLDPPADGAIRHQQGMDPYWLQLEELYKTVPCHQRNIS